MSQSVRVVAFGTPIPKGSMKLVEYSHGKRLARAMLVQDNAHKLEQWAKSVSGAALAACHRLAGYPIEKRPLRVVFTFRLRRPESHFGARGLLPSAPAWPISKPDLDKLERAALDAMTGIVYDDDARVVEVVKRKVYATAAEVVGVVIDVEVIDDAQPLLPLPVVDDRREGAG